MARGKADRLDHIDRRSFLDTAGRLAAGALSLGAISDGLRLDAAWAQDATNTAHPASARVLDRLKSRFMFQISVDVGTIELGLSVAAAALAGGVDIVEMGTPLLKNQGVANVVPAFRRKFPDALLLADMKTMDGGAFEARAVYAGGGNIFDFLALAGVDTAKAICGVRDEFRRSDRDLPRLVFTDIMVPHEGPAKQAGEVALRMIEAGVDGIGVHLQADARRADPSLLARHYLDDMARAIFERVNGAAPVQIVGGLTGPQAKGLAQAGLRCFVISGNLGEPDSRARYDLPPDQIQGKVAGFIAEVSGAR
ncbi:MAG TPA: orotidine 5'-phosphate decarboxylase / HUMPS family protein [Vicinamibacterales bacterium]|jgi:3-keto-L-gulonate-6-phosphate decarboxylase